MADHHSSHGEYKRGEMDVSQHRHSYELFANMTKWGSLLLAVLLVFIVVLTCTQLGFISAALSAIVVAVVGWLLLKKKADPAH